MSTSWNTPLPEQPEQPEQQSRGVSVPHLVMGLVFLGLAGSWLLHQIGVIESVEVQWLLPLVLVVAGVAGLLASLTRGISRGPRNVSHNPSETSSDSPTDETFITNDTTP